MSHKFDDNISSVDSEEIKPTNKKDKQCAPIANFENGSCMSLEILIKMAEFYNKDNNDKIKMSRILETLNPGKYKRYLVREFKRRLDKVCDNQKCWIKQSFMKKLDPLLKNEMITNSFRPKGPEGKFEWLNTLNINDVMKQYEIKYNNYKYLGTVPIDFDDLPELQIKNLDFDDLYNNEKYKLGIIFNLDEHYKGGSHWVGAYADLKEGKVYYFDSYGIPPEKRIRKLLRRISNFIIKKNNKTPIIDYNDVRNQYGGNACGIYSISFILRMLRDNDFDKIKKNPIKDNEINKCREYYFS
jgi:hypothetical protein